MSLCKLLKLFTFSEKGEAIWFLSFPFPFISIDLDFFCSLRKICLAYLKISFLAGSSFPSTFYLVFLILSLFLFTVSFSFALSFINCLQLTPYLYHCQTPNTARFFVVHLYFCFTIFIMLHSYLDIRMYHMLFLR